MSDEFLEIFRVLWTQANPEFHGKYYDIAGIQFYPKPVQQPHPAHLGRRPQPAGAAPGGPGTAIAGIPPARPRTS